MRLVLGSFVAAAIAISAPVTPASAQAQGGITVGMQITDASGGLVGTVAEVKGDNLLVKTDKHEALLPKASFAVGQGKLLFGLTQAQLDAEIEKSLSAASASVVAGAIVNGSGGTEVGKIEAVADGKVTIALASGQKIQVLDSAVRGNADGTVSIGYTSAQLQDLIAKATAGSDSATAKSGGQ